MRKLVLYILLFVVAISANASKGWQQPVVVNQKDGTTLNVCINGDASYNWTSTIDGVILSQKNGEYFVALIDAQGNISASNMLAHNKDIRSTDEQKLCNTQNRNAFFEKVKRETERAETRAIPANGSDVFPHVGSPKVVVILVEFSDVKFKVDAKKAFEQYLNSMTTPHTSFGNWEERNLGSVRKYFSDMSGGKFTPQFDIYGPVTLSQTAAYYGGGNSSSERYQQLVSDACTNADNDIDFSQYDANSDGMVDLVYIIYAGYGEQMSGNDADLWAKAFTCSQSIQKDGKRVRLAGISNELLGNAGVTIPTTSGVAINGIGVFCHEFSHCMGLPDFYPTVTWMNGSEYDYDSYDNQGMEDWDIMDNGIYVSNGHRPTAYTAWEREQMGWMSIDTLSTAQQVMLQSIDQGGKAYRIMSPSDANEYYIVQALKKQGWNISLPFVSNENMGMMMYHVKYEATNFGVFSAGTNSVNNTKKKPRMTMIPADGLLVSSYRRVADAAYTGAPRIKSSDYTEQLRGDLFPGKSAVKELTDANALVNYAPWTGGTLNKPIYNINIKDGNLYFDFLQKFATTGISNARTDAETESKIYSIEGRYVGTDITRLPKGIYIVNGKKIVIGK